MPATLGFDIGGTFTDLVVTDPDGGGLTTLKVLTTPAEPARGALDGVRELLARREVSYGDLARVLHASTLVTNALIEGKGARVGLITTQGFRDVLEMRSEQRYDIYDLFLRFPPPLCPRHLRRGLNERTDRDGRILKPVDPSELEAILDDFRRDGVDAIAVCLLHAYRNPANEREVGRVLAEAWPEVAVSLSSNVAPEIREYERSITTVANAFVQPMASHYLRRLRDDLRTDGLRGPLYPVLSTGSATTVNQAIDQPVRLLESGPAAGAVLAAELGRLIDQPDVLSFDMGGTTAKLCLIQDGRPRLAAGMEAARVHRFKRGSGYPLRIPTVDMLEVGAGGGSVAWVDTLGLLKVGPVSAGADPGPAAYGLGGEEATVTDADLVLGYLNPDYFLGGELTLDSDAAAAAVDRLARRLGLDRVGAAAGIHRLVNENMAAAARIHVLEQARDPRRYGLVCFGGAGPVHAAGVARTLGTDHLIVPAHAGVASAVGLLSSPMAFEFVRSYPTALAAADWKEIEGLFIEMEDEGRALLSEAGVGDEALTVERSVEGRFRGQLHEVRLPLPADVSNLERAAVAADFDATYTQLYRHLPGNMEVELLTWRSRVAAPRPPPPAPPGASGSTDPLTARKGTRPAYFDEAGSYLDTPVFERAELTPGMGLEGPALIEERESTTVLRPAMRLRVDDHGNLRLSRNGAGS